MKPYTCDKCNKCFPTLTNRRRHERIHGGCRLACSLCASSFTQTGDLKKHVRRQHPEAFRACAFCPRYFTADSQLSVHLRRAHPGADLDANRRHAGDTAQPRPFTLCHQPAVQPAGRNIFTARCHASAVLAMGLCLSVSVCPSVRLSQVGVLLKRLNRGSHKQHHTIAQGL